MKLGFIGCGNMARAMISGIASKRKEEIYCYDIDSQLLGRYAEQYGFNVAAGNRELTKEAEVIILAVKPQYYTQVIEEIKDVAEGKLIVSIAPGKTLNWLESQFSGGQAVIRCMPNTPAMVGEGMTALCGGRHVNEEQLSTVKELFECFGRAELVDESMMSAVIAVSGSSPAYIYMLIEAMADSAVAYGMPRKMAYEFAAQSVMGSAKMVLDTGEHPGVLKDMVCSPGGTTIMAVQELEAAGFRSAVMRAMKANVEKAEGM